MTTTTERFFQKVEKPDPDELCWLWTGGDNGQGYGRFAVDGRTVYAHRWSYEYHVAPIEAGMQIDHLCRVPACVNPGHLEPVSPGENVRRGANGFGLTGRCRSGKHDMTDPANVYPNPVNGRRQCRPCRIQSCVDWRSRRAAA